MPALRRFAAHASHVVLYALMFALPLVGWGLRSAADYPIVVYGPPELPPSLPDPDHAALYAMLRTAHIVLAFLLFATFIAHFAAALMHGADLPGWRISQRGVFPSVAYFPAWRISQHGVLEMRRLLLVLILIILPITPRGQPAPRGPPAVGVVPAERQQITEAAEFIGRIQAVGRVALRSRDKASVAERRHLRADGNFDHV